MIKNKIFVIVNFKIHTIIQRFIIVYLITTGHDKNNSDNSCVTHDEWSGLVNIMVFLDTIQTIIIPFMIIAILNLSIGYRLLNKLRQRSRTNMPRN